MSEISREKLVKKLLERAYKIRSLEDFNNQLQKENEELRTAIEVRNERELNLIIELQKLKNLLKN